MSAIRLGLVGRRRSRRSPARRRPPPSAIGCRCVSPARCLLRYSSGRGDGSPCVRLATARRYERRPREPAPGHGFAVIVVASRCHASDVHRVSGLAASSAPRTSSVDRHGDAVEDVETPSTGAEVRLALPFSIADAYSGTPPGTQAHRSQPSASSAAVRRALASGRDPDRDTGGRVQVERRALPWPRAPGPAVGKRDFLPLVRDGSLRSRRLTQDAHVVAQAHVRACPTAARTASTICGPDRPIPRMTRRRRPWRRCSSQHRQRRRRPGSHLGDRPYPVDVAGHRGDVGERRERVGSVRSADQTEC